MDFAFNPDLIVIKGSVRYQIYFRKQAALF